METIDKEEKIRELGTRLHGLDTEADDPGFLSEQTYRRYLEARDWDIEAAEKLLRSTIQWRREKKPQHVVCTFCDAKPGLHPMRHVGFDRQDRPVLYSVYSQCTSQSHGAEDAIQHMLYMTENTIRTMSPHVHQFVWVLDFTGMKMKACNPHIARAVEQIMSNHYPERLGACVCVNHGTVFHAFWAAIKHFIPPATAKKVHMVRHHHKMEELFSELFPEELRHWLSEEIKLNKVHPLPRHQKEFWTEEHSGHDTRGCPSYVSKYLENRKDTDSLYMPHPNIHKHLLEN